MTELALIPGALEETKTRTLDDGGLIEFEQAPAGWLTKDGAPRRAPWRAYFYTPAPFPCGDCTGSVRIPGARPETTKQCPACKGSGNSSRRTRLPSTTTLLDSICPKPGIPPWAEAHGIRGAIAAVRQGLIGQGDSPDDAVAIVREHRLGADAAKKDAADRGINVHALLEEYLTTGAPPKLSGHPAEHRGYIVALTKWLLRTSPEPLAIEQLVAHPEDGYAGRLDLRAMVGGRLITYDAKTQERAGDLHRRAPTGQPLRARRGPLRRRARRQLHGRRVRRRWRVPRDARRPPAGRRRRRPRVLPPGQADRQRVRVGEPPRARRPPGADRSMTLAFTVEQVADLVAESMRRQVALEDENRALHDEISTLQTNLQHARVDLADLRKSA
jgi:hypothetical protein